MPTIGEQLRLAREKQGRSISEVATATCISSRYLAAIEKDDRKSLPGDFFYRNFVKQYAGALRLDAEPLLKELDSMLPREGPDVLPVLSEVYVPAGKTARPSRGKGIIALALLVTAIAGGSALYAWWEKSQRKDATALVSESVAEKKAEPAADTAAAQTSPEPAANASNPAEPAASPAQSQAPEGETNTAAAAPNSSTPPASAPVPTATASNATAPAPNPQTPGGPGVVKLAATEKTWVSVSTNGRTLFSGILEPAETRQFEGVDNAKLVTGNAAGLDVEWNGKAIGPIGPRGQVRTILFSGETFQILTPTPARRM